MAYLVSPYIEERSGGLYVAGTGVSLDSVVKPKKKPRYTLAELLPRSRRADRRCLAVGVGRIVVRIEHLDFIAAHQHHPAVVAALAIPVDLRGRRPVGFPLGKIRAIEQNNGVGRRFGILGARSNHFWTRPGHVMDPPFAIRQERRVVVAE